MKYFLSLLLSVFLIITTNAQQPFQKTEKIHAYIIEGNVAEDEGGAYRTEANTSFFEADQYRQLPKSKLMNAKTVTLYEHIVNGEIRTPSGRLRILANENDIPKSVEYTKAHPTSKFVILNIINSPYSSLEQAYQDLRNKDWVKEVHVSYTNYFEVHSDPFFPQQYFLKNTGQFGGTAGVDINVEDAWKLTTGSSSVKVAVIDDGTEDHVDLEDGSGNSRIVDGHTPKGGGDGSPEEDEVYHGMATAGIISASHNNQLVRGVSSENELIAVNIFAPGSDENDIEAGIKWAVDNGADILNNSWGREGQDSEDPVPAVEDGIDYALNNDVIVVFSAGNDGKVVFPGNYSDVITVNSIDNDGTIWGYNGSSSTVELVAPTGDAGEGNGDMYTLDREGFNGENSTDYLTNFGATSAAAPQVSGVLALMLAINPSLTPAQAETAIYNTAVDLGPAGKDNDYGYGRVDAFEAVKEVMPELNNQSYSSSASLTHAKKITGSTSISPGVTLTVDAGDAVVWEGTATTTGGNSTIEVDGTLFIEDGTSFSGIHFDVSSTGEIKIEENTSATNTQIDIASGGSLIIEEGFDATFESSNGFIAYGEVHMNGVNGNEIMFSKSGSSSWDGVHLHGDNSTMSFVEVTDAGTGVTTHSNTGVTIQNVEVFDSDLDGFRFVNTSGDFGYLRAENNGRYGVYFDGGTNDGPSTSIIENNQYAGLYAGGGASVENMANSRIYISSGPSTNGLQASNNSYIEITSSSIYDHGNRDAYASFSSTIDATENWWGNSFPSSSQFEAVSNSTIDHSSHLFTDPLPSGFFKRSVELPPAMSEQEWQSSDNITTLRELRASIKSDSKANALTKLENISENAPFALKNWSKVLRMEILQQQESYAEALALGDNLLSDATISKAVKATTARRMFYSYLYGKQDVQKATEYVQLLYSI